MRKMVTCAEMVMMMLFEVARIVVEIHVEK
jgi:hypothetical protein